MDAITAALISTLGPAALVAFHQMWRRMKVRRARRLRIERHMRIIADSLLMVTMRTDELDQRLYAIELTLKMPIHLREYDFPE